VALALRENAKNVGAFERLLTRCLPKRHSVVAQRSELTLVALEISRHDVNFLAPRQGFEMVPTV
jgi:hypothetical protein